MEKQGEKYHLDISWPEKESVGLPQKQYTKREILSFDNRMIHTIHTKLHPSDNRVFSCKLPNFSLTLASSISMHILTSRLCRDFALHLAAQGGRRRVRK